jgi:hypothetical protein
MDDVRIYNNALTAGDVAALVSIPEPNAIILMMFGICGLWLVRRK